MSSEPESLVLQLLRDARAETAKMRAGMATETEVAKLRSGMTPLRADVAADMIDIRKEIAGVRNDLGEQIVGLHHAVVGYHASAIGHGIIMREPEDRLRGVEQHLDLPHDPRASSAS